MKIIEGAIKPSPVRFGDVSKGQCFTYSQDIFIKIMDQDGNQFLAVNLENGAIRFFPAAEAVYPIEACVLVQGKWKT